MKTAIVVGAGAGGIATAARLAKAGYKVTVLEKNNFLGGRCSLIHHDGYRFDQGPSLLLMPEVFYKTFADLDTTPESEGLELLKCEPNYRIWFHDNDYFELSTDLCKMKPQLERHEGSDGRVKRYFKSDKLRRIFTFASMYLGMNPFEAPGTYSLLQYTELAHGIWYPKGGFVKILEALTDVGKRLGVDYRLNTEVTSVISSQREIRGVKLQSGEELLADTVIINADLVYAYNNLLPPTRYAESLTKRQASCSSISFFWSFDRVIPELQTHNVFLAEEYRESFDAIFHRHDLPAEPSFYVNVPSRIDPSAAPEGKDAVVVLVPVGHLTYDPDNPQDWTFLINHARDVVFKTIESRTGASLRDSLVLESVETPMTWQSKFNLDRGAILGLSHSFFNVLSFRPKVRHDIKGLYFVGASTHPGAGVPVALCGAKIVNN
ncbi:Phytoene desaturase [Penicillium nucicola]|uniref:Phytoene desaturase n=1 Tax=Penicillium nucicola TaxID=1850975 RepID=UPI0025459408|nr:Phytoene desaturase [Penicillium nucicola]KAJ5757146.1 Phytoene desaturase [Penicillium nucicola]